MKSLSLAVFILLISSVIGFALEMEKTEITAPSGRKIGVGIVRPEGAGPFSAVIIQRGSGGNLDGWENALKRYAREGFMAVAIDSSVARGEFDTAAARIKATVEALQNMKDVIPDKIGLWGSSNGGAASLRYSASNSLAAVVTYGAIYTQASDAATKISSPILILHGSDDTTSSPNLAKLYFKELAEKNHNARLKILEGKEHKWDSDVMTESIAFFKEKLK